MLNQILKEIETAQGVVDINQLSRKTGIERPALEGMLQTLEAMGRLNSAGSVRQPVSCMAACKGCSGMQGCSLMRIKNSR